MKSLLIITLSATIAIATKVNAQIVPDATLPANSTINTIDNITEITGGTSRGNNLFHSFEQFSLSTGNTAFFNNALEIQNIFSRITGNNISNIDGLIRTNGDANLFLINPNGIIFGENATLDIGGSFTATTGAIVFADDTTFSSINDNNEPLLTVSIPVGIQLGNVSQGTIEVKGSGNNLYFDPDFFDVNISERPTGLSTVENQSLTLAAANIEFDGGNITAPNGNLNLVASDRGIFNLESNNLDLAGTGNINLTNAASASTRGIDGGAISIAADVLQLQDGSAILGDTEGEGIGGDTNILVKKLNINGFSDSFSSAITRDSTAFATGKSGNINIEAEEINITNGGLISNIGFFEGGSGDINIETKDLNINGVGLFVSQITAQSTLVEGGDINIKSETISLSDFGEIITYAYGLSPTGKINIETEDLSVDSLAGIRGISFDGKVEDINIEAQNIDITDGGRIENVNSGFEDAGEVNINADRLSIRDGNESLVSGIYSTAENEGNATAINIDTNELKLLDGGSIEASTFFSSANGANININANTITAIGYNDDNETATIASGIRSVANFDTSGNGGQITINTNNLKMQEAAQISTTTAGIGNAGSIIVNAEDVALEDFIELGRTAIITSAISSSGNAGGIILNTENLRMDNGATITASNFPTRRTDIEPGTGKAGSVEINANNISLSSTTEPSSITTATVDGGNGEITLNSDRLYINNSEITSETIGEGDGGTIAINSNEISLLNNSSITSESSGTGDAGKISLDSDRTTINSGTITTTATDLGQAGDITLKTNDLSGSEADIIAESNLTGGGNINLTTQNVNLNNNSLISTSVRDSNGGGGNINIENNNLILLQNNSDIRANAILGPGGNINITSNLFLTDLDSDIDASSQFGLDGTVEINRSIEPKIVEEELPSSYQPSQVIPSLCPIAKENSFSVTGKGGLATNPLNTENFTTQLWEEEILNTTDNTAETIVISRASVLKEADNIVIDSSGKIQLVASSKTVNPTDYIYCN